MCGPRNPFGLRPREPIQGVPVMAEAVEQQQLKKARRQLAALMHCDVVEALQRLRVNHAIAHPRDGARAVEWEQSPRSGLGCRVRRP